MTPSSVGPASPSNPPSDPPAGTLPPGFVERRVDVEGRSTRYVEGGDGPPLVTVHGGGGLDRELGAVHAALAEDRRVLAVELPGFGDTAGDGFDSMPDLARFVAAFATAVGVETFALLGTSFGGAVGLWTTLLFPGRVDALVLEAPAAFREGVPGPGEIPPFTPDGTPIPRPDPARVAFMQRVSGPATDPELLARMPECAVPTLVLLGTDDRLFGPRFAQDYTRLPSATVSLVYGAGHDIKGSRPDAFLSIVADFLTRGPSFVISQRSTLVHP